VKRQSMAAAAAAVSSVSSSTTSANCCFSDITGLCAACVVGYECSE
jgi:hypothetical protein